MGRVQSLNFVSEEIVTDTNGSIRGRILGEEFFDRPTPMVAWDLLGKILVHRTAHGPVAGKIVETEAYLGGKDPACHASAGKTERNQIFYHEPAQGTVYVFSSFGIHHCVNILTSGEKPAGCVLLRAVEPLAGLRIMEKNRGTRELRQLTSGPGRLSQALGITRSLNGRSIAQGPLIIVDCRLNSPSQAVGTRVGLKKARDYPLRYFLTDNEFVSRSSARFFSNSD